MKSRTRKDELLVIAFAVLNDCACYYCDSTLTKSFLRDKKRLHDGFLRYGYRLFVSMLPELEQALLGSLETGYASFTSLPFSQGKRGEEKYPRLFGGLFRRIFHPDGRLRDVAEVDPQAIFFLRQLLAGFKKLKVPERKGATDETVQSFLTLDQSLPLPSRLWEDDRYRADMHDSRFGMCQVSDLGHFRLGGGGTASQGIAYESKPFPEETVESTSCESSLATVNAVFRLISSTLGEVSDWSDLQPRHGNGTVSDYRRGDYKYVLPNWDTHLERLFPYTEFGTTSGIILDNSVEIPASLTNYESRLAAVPKTYKSPRLIASEPCCLMFLQQALSGFIRGRIENSWLRSFLMLSDQTRNQTLAQAASRNRSLATLDLSEASDRLTCRHIEILLQGNMQLLDMVASTRSLRTSLKNFSQKQSISLRKFATMGSALTFPLESLVFLGVALSGVLIARSEKPSLRAIRSLRSCVSVYGDDIIVPTDSYAVVRSLLEAFGFKINANKTFSNGYFRESCGVDAYNGVNVTPIKGRVSFVSRQPENIVSLIAYSNNLHKAGLWRASRAAGRIVGTLTKVKVPITHVSAECLGFQSYVGSYSRKKWEPDLCRYSTRRLVLRSLAEVKQIEASTAPVIQYHVEKPYDMPNWQSGVVAFPTNSEKKFSLSWKWE